MHECKGICSESKMTPQRGEEDAQLGKAGGLKTTPLCTKSREGAPTLPRAFKVPHPQTTSFPLSKTVCFEESGRGWGGSILSKRLPRRRPVSGAFFLRALSHILAHEHQGGSGKKRWTRASLEQFVCSAEGVRSYNKMRDKNALPISSDNI